MATIANQYDPNDENQNSSSSGTSSSVAPDASSGSSGSAPSAPPSSTPTNRTTPSGAPNVQSYLNANQGAGQQLTNGISNNVQNQANTVNTAATNAATGADSQYQPLSSTLNKGQDVATTAFKNPQALLDAYNAQKSASSNAAPQSADQQTNADQYDQFQKFNTGGYDQQIQNFNNYGQQQSNQLQNQLNDLGQQTSNGSNEMGRTQLLQNAVGQGNYNQGEQTLDNLFLQGTPGQTNAHGLSNLQQLQQNLGNIQNSTASTVNNFNSNTNQKLQALQGLSAGDQAGIKNLFTTGAWSGNNPEAASDVNSMGLNGIGSDVASRYASAQAKAALTPQLQKDLAAGTLTNDQIQTLGLTSGQQTWGADLSPYLQVNALNAANAGGNAQVASQDEFARYNALNQLAGGPNGLQNSIFGGASSVGNYKPVDYNAAAANSAIADRKQLLNGSDYKNAVNALMPALGAPTAQTGAGFHSAVYDTDAPIRNQLASGIANGTLTPDQAMAAINQFQQNTYNEENPDFRGGMMDYFHKQFSPFTDWYNKTYAPAAHSVIGQTSPDDATHQLPTNAKGGVDWSAIKAPQGK